MGYTRSAVAGVGWNSIVKILTMVVAAGKIFILARLLTPHDFGLFSLVAIAIGLMEATTETGINTTIVQSPRSVHYFLDTAWVIAIIRGLIISILMIVIGVFMRSYFQESQLFFLVAIASLIPLIKGFINPAVIGLYKELRFFRDSVYRFSLVIVDAAFAIGFAFLFRSVMAFILAMIVAALFEVAISFLFFRDRPQLHYLPNRAREIFSNAKGLNLSSLLNYVSQNIDNFLVGKLLGISPLGIYANGYTLSHKFNVEFAKSVYHGTLPVYVRISQETQRLRRAFWRALASSLGGVVLVSLPFLLFPKLVVELLLGSQWGLVVPILPLLVLAGITQSLFLTSAALFTAKKKYLWLNLSLGIICSFMVILLFIFAPRFGLLGAAWALLLARLVAVPVILGGIRQTLYE